MIIRFPSDYPFKPPNCKFSTKIFHPNILPDGKICKCGPFKELGVSWSPNFTISFILNKITKLFIEPYLGTCCADPKVLYLYKLDKKEFDKKAKEWTRKYDKWLMNIITF